MEMSTLRVKRKSSASQSNVSSSPKAKSRKRTKNGDEDSDGSVSNESNNDDAAEKKKTSRSKKEPGSSSRKTKQYTVTAREKILQKLRNFKVYFSAYDGFEVTDCSFVKTNVEICYILKDAQSIDKEMLKESLASHLGIQVDDLKLMELRSRPVYKETSIQPGDRVCLNGQPHSRSYIGAFVNVPGKGIHALMCGHGKTPGDTFCLQNGNRLGEVKVSLTTPLPRIPTNEGYVFRDISLGRLYDHTSFISTVTTDDGTTLRLKEDPEEAHDEMLVRLFTNGDRRGRIRSTLHVRMDGLNIGHRYLHVQNSEGQPVHHDGESGILIVSEPSGDHAEGALASVTAVGMLVSREMREYAADNRIEILSLAAPLKSGFDALRSDPYCNGEVKFC